MKIWIVDAFTESPFAGNPAAVVLVEGEVDSDWMQHVGQELNLSETAFVEPRPEPGRFGLRWFTPKTEVDLCGHATLAAAHVLWTNGGQDRADPIAFETRSGLLSATFLEGRIELDFPSLPPVDEPIDAAVVDVVGQDVGVRNQARSQFDLLVELKNESQVRTLRPDLEKLLELPHRGLIVTAEASPATRAAGIDFVSRFFAPTVGIPEDPVTGSAHCVLAPYWARRIGRTAFTSFQASPRGGCVYLRLEGPRTILAGHAVTVLRGSLLA
jgi:PhzF family phenazine biosynthesis protein